MRGKIIKGIAGFYYVVSGETTYACKAKGSFRSRGIKPLIGDDVEFAVTDEKDLEGNIEEILPRRNSLIRPLVSNADLGLAVIAAARPAPALYLLDKYLISMEMQDLPAVIVINKTDLAEDKGEQYARIYRQSGYEVFLVSTVTGEGIEELKARIRGKSAVLAGPSGVGKSSLTNLLCPDAQMQTGDISRKIERGKHTTRHSQFFRVEEDTYLCDTPGFTAVLVDSLLPEQLRLHMPELAALEGRCRYDDCMHLAEPGCKVKDAVEQGMIPVSRYESYRKIYEELRSIPRY